jgi:hypothetical protein
LLYTAFARVLAMAPFAQVFGSLHRCSLGGCCHPCERVCCTWEGFAGWECLFAGWGALPHKRWRCRA